MTDTNSKKLIADYNQAIRDAEQPGFSEPSLVEDTKDGGLWLHYNNCSVRYRNGNVLHYNGAPLRASVVQAYVSDIDYTLGLPGERFTAPGGRGVQAYPGWRYAQARQAGMVIHRADDVVLYELLSTGAAGAPIINFLTNVQNIHVNINDGTSGKGYSDNDGAFDLHLKILQW